ncbi:MAG: type II toxin-antitoxin system HicB family antitoxin [Bacteroidota bacterium]|nr:type II toxin-antitoxin system HicB family antitoxin [Bacteroidota bacterium]
MKFALTEYIETVMASAAYEKLEDETYAGRIPKCKGVIAFGKSLKQCEDELRSTLEDWILVGLKLGHKLPVINGINLNKDVKRVALASL